VVGLRLGVDRSEVTINALVRAFVQISDRSPAADPPEIQLIALQKRSA
jgi:hypothetical protein